MLSWFMPDGTPASVRVGIMCNGCARESDRAIGWLLFVILMALFVMSNGLVFFARNIGVGISSATKMIHRDSNYVCRCEVS